MITDQQVKLLRVNMTKYSNQKISAAKSGMSERSARKYLKANSLPSELRLCCVNSRSMKSHGELIRW